MSALAAFGSIALAHAGMTGLALAMDRHHRQLRPTAGRPGRFATAAWRVAGWALLALSLKLSVLAWGSSTGTAAWFGVLSATSLALILTLPYAPILAWRAGWFTAIMGFSVAFARLVVG